MEMGGGGVWLYDTGEMWYRMILFQVTIDSCHSNAVCSASPAIEINLSPAVWSSYVEIIALDTCGSYISAYIGYRIIQVWAIEPWFAGHEDVTRPDQIVERVLATTTEKHD